MGSTQKSVVVGLRNGWPLYDMAMRSAMAFAGGPSTVLTTTPKIRAEIDGWSRSMIEIATRGSRAMLRA